MRYSRTDQSRARRRFEEERRKNRQERLAMGTEFVLWGHVYRVVGYVWRPPAYRNEYECYRLGTGGSLGPWRINELDAKKAAESHE